MKGWQDLAKWHLQENLPGSFPFTAGIYPFTHNNFGDHSYSDNKWRTWLDLDTDIGKYVKELGQELIGATIVAYVQHSSGSWFYGGPQRGRIDAVSMTTINTTDSEAPNGKFRALPNWSTM